MWCVDLTCTNFFCLYFSRKRLNKKAFYEEEAELSGSDVPSEDEELGSEFDEYEVESDVEEGLPTGEKLKRQVHRIHQ